jgi:hypothetical protein
LPAIAGHHRVVAVACQDDGQALAGYVVILDNEDSLVHRVHGDVATHKRKSLSVAAAVGLMRRREQKIGSLAHDGCAYSRKGLLCNATTTGKSSDFRTDRRPFLVRVLNPGVPWWVAVPCNLLGGAALVLLAFDLADN